HRRRRRRRDRHLLRQVHTAPRGGGTTARRRALHGRPPPRLRGTPGRLAIPRRPTRGRGHRTVRPAAGLSSHPRRRRTRRPRRDRGRQVTVGRPVVAHAATVPVRRRRPLRG